MNSLIETGLVVFFGVRLFFFISSKFPFFFLFFLAFPPPLPPLSLAFQDWFSFPINFIFDPQEEKTSK